VVVNLTLGAGATPWPAVDAPGAHQKNLDDYSVLKSLEGGDRPARGCPKVIL
jgi:hypothetical protein